MALLDGLFVSKEERERRTREFDRRVFPLGLEAQRQAAQDILAPQVAKGRAKENELLFAYIVAKDKYLLDEKGEAGFKSAVKQLKRLGWLTRDQKNFILALVMLDCEITSLDDFPESEDVLAMVNRGFLFETRG